MNVKGKQRRNQVKAANIYEQQEVMVKVEAIKNNLKASTWHELETNGKFAKNEKLTFISDDMLILGCDVGSETHYVRAIDTRGRELSKSAFPFSNTLEGFQSAKEWAVSIAAIHDKPTYCSNMARSGMNPKTLQYLMGHSEIGVTLNTYTHLGLEDATDEFKRVQEI